MKKQFHFNATFTLKIFCIIILFSTSCVENNREINNLFNALEKQINNEKVLNHIKTFHQDSSNLLLPIFSPQYRDLKEVYFSIEEDTFTDSSLYSDEEIMLFAFQKYLNQQPIDLGVIQDEVKESKMRLKIKRDKKEVLYKERLEEIIRTNNLKWQEGDTINVLLQVDNDSGYNSIYYRSYPASLDYSFADDTLEMKGLIKKKISPATTDYLDIIFRLKILELNRPDVYNFAKKIKTGEEFDLHLESYARLIP